MNEMSPSGTQAPYDAGSARIHWNVRPRDIHMVAGAILAAGLAIAGGLAWSGYEQAQAMRCMAIPQSPVLIERAEGTARAEVAGRVRRAALALGCDDALLLGE